MICDCCGKEGAVTKYLSRSFGSGADIVVIDGIPMVACPHCGERYFAAETLHEVEQLRRHRKSVAASRQAPVFNYLCMAEGDRNAGSGSQRCPSCKPSRTGRPRAAARHPRATP